MNNPALRITVPESVLFRDLDGEAVLLETVTGRYFGLDEVGTTCLSRKPLGVRSKIDTDCDPKLTTASRLPDAAIPPEFPLAPPFPSVATVWTSLPEVS